MTNYSKCSAKKTSGSC